MIEHTRTCNAHLTSSVGCSHVIDKVSEVRRDGLELVVEEVLLNLNDLARVAYSHQLGYIWIPRHKDCDIRRQAASCGQQVGARHTSQVGQVKDVALQVGRPTPRRTEEEGGWGRRQAERGSELEEVTTEEVHPIRHAVDSSIVRRHCQLRWIDVHSDHWKGGNRVIGESCYSKAQKWSFIILACSCDRTTETRVSAFGYPDWWLHNRFPVSLFFRTTAQ